MGLQKEISQQYLRKNQVTVTILDVLSPVHFTVKESPSLDGSIEAKDFIEAEEAMQKFYESVEPCFFKLPLKDTIIVAYYKDKFYRAKVIRILTLSSGHLFKVYLVDYGIECSVPRGCIYEIEKDFLAHPFQAVNFKLLGIEPISLIMNVDLTMSYGPVSDWDPSANKFVQDLLKGMCNAYIEVQGRDEEHIFGKLFISYESNVTKCLNDELVSNNFARFNEDCWENVQIIGSPRGNTNAQAKLCRTVESLNCQGASPKQVSTSSDVEQLFKVRFVSPKDGRVVAESFLSSASTTENEEKDDDDDSDSEELPVKSPKPPSSAIFGFTSEEQQPVQDSKSPLSPTSDSISKEQLIAQKRFLKLQRLHRKQLKSPVCADNSATMIVKSIPAVTENRLNEENYSADISTVEVKQSSAELSSRNAEIGAIHRNSVSPCKTNVSNDCDNSNTDKKSSDINCANQAALSSTSSPDASKGQTVGQLKFLKLQKLHRKQLPSPICPSRSIQQLSSATGSAVTLEQSSGSVSSEKTDNSSSQMQANHNNNDTITKLSELNISDVCNNNSNSSAESKVSVPPVSDNNLQQKNVTQEELIAHKRLQKLQLLHRKKLRSPICDNPEISQTSTSKIPSEDRKKQENTPEILF